MISPGSRLGPYEVLGSLGAGGMGQVYRARDTRLGRDVALKVLPDAFANDPERLARFQREAQVLASLSHPNIGAIHGLEVNALSGPDEARAGGPVRALVLELVEGETLAERIARGPIPADEALPMARQIADALQAAHEQGVTHRDLKPANVKVTPDGVVKVLDFGLAKLMASPAATEISPSTAAGQLTLSPTITSPMAMTGVGVLLGTAPYMSPEQAKGREADRRSDVWAFGCVLFEMLTARRAFEGEDTSDTLAMVLKGEPDWTALPASTPAAVRAFIRRCLEKDRRKRIADVSTALAVIEDLSVGAAADLPVPRRRSPWRAVAAGAALLMAGSLAWYAGWRARGEPRPPASFEIALPADQTFSFLGRHVIALSPAGTHIAYVANQQLYVRAMNQLEGVPLRGTEGGREPFFSPDGQWIGFWSAGAIRKVALTGGAPVHITPAQNPTGASWGADGQIAYAQTTGIWSVSAEGGTPRQIVTLRDGELPQSPQVLPGGRLLFTVAPKGDWSQSRIVVQQPDTDERIDLFAGQDARYVDTGHLVYMLEGTLFAVPFEPSSNQPASGPVSLVEGVGEAISGLGGAAQFSTSADGTLVYVPPDAIGLGGTAPRSLLWVDRAGRESPTGAPPRAYAYPRLSPDGRQVALDVRDQENDIWIWDLSGRSPLRQLTFGSDIEQFVVWDRDFVVYSSGAAPAVTSARALFRRRADGRGEPQEIVRSQAGIFPLAVARDGTLFVRQIPWSDASQTITGQSSDLMVLPGGAEPLKHLFGATPALETNAELSPDETLVAYQSDEVDSRPEVWVRSYPDVNGSKQRVTYTGGTRPMWSRKGDELFYESNGALMAVTVTPGPTFGNPRMILEPRYFLGGQGATPVFGGAAGRTYDISLDGARFLVLKDLPTQGTEAAPRARMLVVQGWFDELRTRVPAR